MGKWTDRLTEISSEHAGTGLTKPTKPGSVSFDSALPVCSENFRGARDHAWVAWTGEEIDRYTNRVGLVLRRGYPAAGAERVAEELMQRDREGLDMRMCIECRNLTGRGRCRAAAAGRVAGASRDMEPRPLVLMRCEGFVMTGAA